MTMSRLLLLSALLLGVLLVADGRRWARHVRSRPATVVAAGRRWVRHVSSRPATVQHHPAPSMSDVSDSASSRRASSGRASAIVQDDMALGRRSLWEFGKMIHETTGVNRLKYANYGCWCGKGGQGTPVDATDRCCYVHDKCYDRLLLRPDCDPYTVEYVWQYGGGSVTCSSQVGSCAQDTCVCDKVASECFARNLDTYSARHILSLKWFCK